MPLGRVARGTPVREKENKYYYPSISSRAKTSGDPTSSVDSVSDQGGKDRRRPVLLSSSFKTKSKDGWSSSSSPRSLEISSGKKKTFVNRASSAKKRRTEGGPPGNRSSKR